jgi:hypothetical protein
MRTGLVQLGAVCARAYGAAATVPAARASRWRCGDRVRLSRGWRVLPVERIEERVDALFHAPRVRLTGRSSVVPDGPRSTRRDSGGGSSAGRRRSCRPGRNVGPLGEGCQLLRWFLGSSRSRV